jgi:hypothetical protein
MALLFILFSTFSILIPVILEARRTQGDHIVKQVGAEVVGSEMVRRLSERIAFIPQAGVRVVAFGGSAVALVAILWIIVKVVQLLF